jgi:hypothetical protein
MANLLQIDLEVTGWACDGIRCRSGRNQPIYTRHLSLPGGQSQVGRNPKLIGLVRHDLTLSITYSGVF